MIASTAMTNETEQWRDIPGFEGAYQVSDRGRVRSLNRVGAQLGRGGKYHRHTHRGQFLRPARMSSGHVSVVLGRKAGSRSVHSLIALAFIGPRSLDKEVRHLNVVPDDNRLENLEYATRARNIQDKKWHGAHRKLRPADVRDIKRRLDGPHGTQADLAREYRVRDSTISAIKHKRIHQDVLP
jgi:NUMOD4 motif/HNH endonuclease